MHVLSICAKPGVTFNDWQYLAPSAKHHPVVEYVHPRRAVQEKAYAMGFAYVASAPLVRSSYLVEKRLNPLSNSVVLCSK